MRGRNELVDVVLEGDEAEGDEESPALVAVRRELTRLDAAPRTWPVVAAVLAVLASAAVATQGGALAAEERRLADATGLVESLAEPWHEVWQADGTRFLGLAGNVLVLTGRDYPGVLAVDAATGEELWRAEDVATNGYCTVADLDLELVGWFDVPSRIDPARARVVCTRNAVAAVDGAMSTTLTGLVLDPATGTVLQRVEGLVDGTGGNVAAVGEVLTLSGAVDGQAWAQGWSLVTGKRLWDWTGDAPGDEVWWNSGGQYLWLYGTATVVLDARTGERVEGPVEVVALSADLTGGRTSRSVFPIDGPPVVVVTDASGAEVYRGAGYHLPAQARDATSGDVLVVTDTTGGTTGLDTRTWEPLWDATGQLASLAHVGGVIVSTDGATTRALDARTGEELWTLSPGSGWPSIVTDGRRLAFVAPDALDELVVVRLSDGVEERRDTLPIAAMSSLVPLPDGTMLQTADSGVALLAP